MNRNDISGSDSGATQANIGTLIAFVLLVFVGGNNAVAVRFSNLELPPFWGAGIRFASAALIFWTVVLVRRTALPKGRALIGALLYGVLAVGAAYAFLYWAILRVEAGLAMLPTRWCTPRIPSFVLITCLLRAISSGSGGRRPCSPGSSGVRRPRFTRE